MRSNILGQNSPPFRQGLDTLCKFEVFWQQSLLKIHTLNCYDNMMIFKKMARLLKFTYLANNTTLCSDAERDLKNRPVDSRCVNLLGMFLLVMFSGLCLPCLGLDFARAFDKKLCLAMLTQFF